MLTSTYAYLKYINIQKSRNTHISTKLFLKFLCFPFSLLNFGFTIYFYILVLYWVFEKHKLGNSTIDQIGKTAFTAEFLTVSNNVIYIYIYIYTIMKTMCPPRLPPQWFCGNPCTWAHDVHDVHWVHDLF